jgi:post-segregation antitoxin (ccd killing protein)
MEKYRDNTMIRTQISVDRDLYARAKIVARRQGISLAALCRRGLEEAVAREPTDKPWMAFAGIVEGSPSDSESVDEVVYGRERP